MKKEYTEFLNKLKDSGKINMFQAVPYIQRKFKVKKDEAKAILFAWIHSFDK